MVQSEKDPAYRQCAVTVMDNISDPDITFDDKGISNYYYEYKRIEQAEAGQAAGRGEHLRAMIDKIKEEGKGKPYDCITGVSGGVDSSYLILMAKKWGLRPLIVHFDNGWNSEIAVKNINSIIEHTGFDLYTIVVNWEEFRDIQLSYIKAGVVDWEVPTDHAIYATWFRLSKKYNVSTILSGNNVVTEAIMPPSWIFNKADHTNLLNIHDRFGAIPIKTYPVYGSLKQQIRSNMKGVTAVKPLNFIDYDKKQAKEQIKTEFGWVDYGGKHYESVYTKFYQAYVLPQKFHIDKRKPHLTNLILSGQITRDEALQELRQPLYAPAELLQEKEYVLKKLGLTPEEFEGYMTAPRVEHATYGVQEFLTERYPFLKAIRPIVRMFKK